MTNSNLCDICTVNLLLKEEKNPQEIAIYKLTHSNIDPVYNTLYSTAN